jgi:DNA-binding transcriptional ArsR family regulator
VYPWIRAQRAGSVSTTAPDFAFLTNHGKTLLVIAHDPRIRIRDIAALLQITERAAQRIVSDLVEAGYLDRLREGRRYYYRVKADRPLRHPVERGHHIGEILSVLHDANTT